MTWTRVWNSSSVLEKTWFSTTTMTAVLPAPATYSPKNTHPNVGSILVRATCGCCCPLQGKKGTSAATKRPDSSHGGNLREQDDNIIILLFYCDPLLLRVKKNRLRCSGASTRAQHHREPHPLLLTTAHQ
uniref:Uncharacterized protein n=1 Tax=Knipowitschia caucasica TaxID=637954 RepID=A0AAV2KJY1_KNICA